MLESYLLGLFCPTEQQQRSNQAAAVQAATLAVQGAARVTHVSHGSEDDDDEEEKQQQEQQQEPGSSSTPATAAGAAASIRVNWPQQRPQEPLQAPLLPSSAAAAAAGGGVPGASSLCERRSAAAATAFAGGSSSAPATARLAAADSDGDVVIVDERPAPKLTAAAAAAAPPAAAAAAAVGGGAVAGGSAGEAAAAAAAGTFSAAAVRWPAFDAALLDRGMVLPLVWNAAAFDKFVCKFVTSRRVATLWDLRQQLLALHGLRQHPRALEQTRLLLQLSPPAYAGGQAAGLMVSPAARRFFSPAAELAEVPAATLKSRACFSEQGYLAAFAGNLAELSAAVSRCLCATFGVQHVQQLGHGSTQRLLHLCAAAAAAAADTLAGCPGSSQSCVWGVHALAAPVSSPSAAAAAAAAAGIANQPAADQSLQLRQEVPEGAAAGDSAGAAGSVSVEDALCCLAAAPQLAELHGWSSWQQYWATVGM
ncbi:hypothetical protein OEZ86_003377 [Tetradesmus obliquus]|nr:hypothetical protein OEZ86_003377 [Tetradesmus obliquus]